ncbi:hypothetical protein D3C79_1024190 [compost metagenome]
MKSQEEKVDVKELAAALEQLSEKEKIKFFYMIKGIELIRENETISDEFGKQKETV